MTLSSLRAPSMLVTNEKGRFIGMEIKGSSQVHELIYDLMSLTISRAQTSQANFIDNVPSTMIALASLRIASFSRNRSAYSKDD
mmetsp:Transcript_8550/g.17326  ORF Transcript_8550/g.17326 Transcript_8550/m.17326 type:complete len:84 (+) Transcript_8550:1911-2162(+)